MTFKVIIESPPLKSSRFLGCGSRPHRVVFISFVHRVSVRTWSSLSQASTGTAIQGFILFADCVLICVQYSEWSLFIMSFLFQLNFTQKTAGFNGNKRFL